MFIPFTTSKMSNRTDHDISSGNTPTMNLGTCGIIRASLRDPVSELLDKITRYNTRDTINTVSTHYPLDHKISAIKDIYNAIGIYYEKADDYVVYLFSVYDCDNYIDFTNNNLTDITDCPLISNIICHPAEFNAELFVKTANQEIKKAMKVNAVYQNYECLLLDSLGLEYNNKWLTGFDMVNSILRRLTGGKYSISQDNIAIRSPIGPPVKIKDIGTEGIGTEGIGTLGAEGIGTVELKITDPMRRRLTVLAAVALNLYTDHHEFNHVILHTLDYPTLLQGEEELVQFVNDSVSNRLFSLADYNHVIQRADPFHTNIKLGNDAIRLTAESVKHLSLNNGKTTNALGTYLQELVACYQQKQEIVIHLDVLINYYNDMVKPPLQIEIPDCNVDSKSGIVTLNKMPSVPTHLIMKDMDMMNDMMDSEISMINMDYTDWQKLSKQQLIDLLIYIDSLGSVDENKENVYSYRFIRLQNEIAKELSSR
jgi:hypothetical protein